MRVSDSQIYDLSRTHLAGSRERFMALQRQALEGKRVLAPSDDPVAAGRARGETARASRAEDHLRTINVGLAALQLADSALSQVGEVLARVRELAIQQSSDTMGADERAAAATEVRELAEVVRGLANSEMGGRHVFAGYRDGTAPFDASGAYLGDDGVRELEVGPGVRLPMNVPGNRVFGTAGGGVDVFALLTDLDAALQANDVAAVRSTLGSLEVATGQIADARGEIGAHQRAFEVARAAAEQAHLRAVDTASTLVDADPIETYISLSQARTALEAAVGIAAQLPLPGLASR